MRKLHHRLSSIGRMHGNICTSVIVVGKIPLDNFQFAMAIRLATLHKFWHNQLHYVLLNQ